MSAMRSTSPWKNRSIGYARCGVQIHNPRPDERGQEADSDDESRDLGCVVEPTHHADLDQHSQRWCEDEQHDGEGGERGQPPLLVELPVGERAEHADRAVGEVEDAGRGVGEHEADSRHREDGRRAQPDHRGGEELIHGRACSGRAGRYQSGLGTP
jgi:hypothetical protein